MAWLEKARPFFLQYYFAMKNIGNSTPYINYKNRWIYIGALTITLYFDTKTQDPFNSPKFWVLILISSVLLSYVATSGHEIVKIIRSNKRFFYFLFFLCLVHLACLGFSTLNSYDWKVALFGESFRRNGLLTTFSFFLFFISATLFIRFKDVQLILKVLLCAGLITGTYGLIQISGNDWIAWSSKNIISTFGNTNFSGSGMAIFSISIFGLAILSLRNKTLAFLYLLIFLFLVYVILQTNARQAILILILGLSIFLCLFLYRKDKKFGLFAFLVISFAIIFAILAIFQIGPLQGLIYKNSLAVREFYWKAGIEMFRSFPLFGVGPDHYGIYFKEFRDVGYPLTYGWAITSSNAHNVFIQNFATGGFLVGVSYVAIQGLIAYRTLCLIKKTNGQEQAKVTLLFSAWVAYQAQSLFSIEFIGISIWGWVLGGTLLGLSLNNQEVPPTQKGKSINLNTSRLLITPTLLILAILIISPVRQGEKAIWRQSVQYDPTNQQKVDVFERATSEVIENRFINTDYKNLAVVRVLSIGANERAIKILNELIIQDPRNLDTLALLVDTYEKIGDYDKAVYFRNQISKYDPWNAKNYLGLAQLYKQLGRYDEMTSMVEKILSFASDDPIASVAKNEFPPIAN